MKKECGKKTANSDWNLVKDYLAEHGIEYSSIYRIIRDNSRTRLEKRENCLYSKS